MITTRSKKNFKKLSKKEKDRHIKNLLDKHMPLEEYEFEAATKEQKEENIENKINSAGWLETYETKAANKDQLERYITRKRFLSPEEFMRLDDDLKKLYIEKSASSSISLTETEFFQLSEELRKFYINSVFSKNSKFAISAKMASYLKPSNQIKYIDFIFKENIGLSEEELSCLNKKTQSYFKKMKEELFEVRRIVKRLISENLFNK